MLVHDIRKEVWSGRCQSLSRERPEGEEEVQVPLKDEEGLKHRDRLVLSTRGHAAQGKACLGRAGPPPRALGLCVIGKGACTGVAEKADSKMCRVRLSVFVHRAAPTWGQQTQRQP